jgi:kinesin family member C2/C3
LVRYGITSSGKTHTMEGTERDRGVLYRSIETLLENSHHAEEEYHTDITLSVMEVYNEKIR